MFLFFSFCFPAKGTLSEDTIRLFLRQLGKRNEEKREEAEKILRFDKKYVRSYVFLGRVYFVAGKKDENLYLNHQDFYSILCGKILFLREIRHTKY